MMRVFASKAVSPVPSSNATLQKIKIAYGVTNENHAATSGIIVYAIHKPLSN